VNWSPNSKWIAYSKTLRNLNDAIYLYSMDDKKVIQATSGYYNDTRPVFDQTGKYLFFATDRSFNANYSNQDATWIYPNTTQIAFATLDPTTQSIIAVQSETIQAANRKVDDFITQWVKRERHRFGE